MNTSSIIHIEQVSKRFKLATARNRNIFNILTRRAKSNSEQADYLWAVKDISFTVMRGESVGLIGHNGSGKSTLLKLITRILYPTSGTIHVNGRISPLLELGAGFHADLTGRENIYLNASVLGLSNPEIDQRIEEIIAFSELEQFIDTPVKHYSSGMYMRLGFSVAVHCDPDILLVDEILAVGDHAFQRKCLDRIAQLKRQGVTIMMVSHSLDTLLKLCDSIVWMEHGVMREKGAPQPTIARYTDFMNTRIAEQGGAGEFVFNRHGTYEVEIIKVRFLDAAGVEQSTFHTEQPLIIEMYYDAHRPIYDPEFGIAIYRDDGVQITGPNNRIAGQNLGTIEGRGVVTYVVGRLSLLPSSYTVTVAIHDGTLPQAYDYHAQAYKFRVVADENSEFQGVLSLPAEWTHMQVPE
ncbi:MAG TPA: ABC transporter ATP-binding protein [Anaerolineae bacterium]|nr:ABC transporter ATP-binding protein [Anaerolineae bacterium]